LLKNWITLLDNPGGGAQSSVCTPIQTGGGGGGQNATTNATTITMAGGSTDATADKILLL